jgi:hypothetical protein
LADESEESERCDLALIAPESTNATSGSGGTAASGKCADLPAFHSYWAAIRPSLALFDELVSFKPSQFAISEYQAALQPYLACEPSDATVLNRPAKLTHDCSDTALFTGQERAGGPVKVWDVNPISCELDVLEIRLFELEGVVDMHVLLESPYTHRLSEKQLCFTNNRKRFRRFRSRIKVFVADDADLDRHGLDPAARRADGDDWGYETRIMRELPLEKLRAAAAAHSPDDPRFPRPEDLVVSGDIDEIPEAQALLNLKFCAPKQEAVLGHFRSVHFVLNFDYTVASGSLQLPRVQAWASLGSRLPRKEKAPGPRYGGGYHLNGFQTPFGLVLKELGLAEGGHLGSTAGHLQRWRAALEDPRTIQPLSSTGKRVCCELSHECCNRDGKQRSRHDERFVGADVPW